jgi:NAD(P)-dependent dehydrogenase (short-subunit alcohol dehydrogenase family)
MPDGSTGSPTDGEVPAVAGRLVLVAGATSASGLAACRDLREAGARVVAVARDRAKLAALEADVPGVLAEVCDLTTESEVRSLADRLHAEVGPVDGILHLVGGWRGGGGLAGQTEADYRVLESSFTALRHTSRAFEPDLRAARAGRLAIVSSTAVERPLAGGANYAAVKAASEAWARATAQGFAKAARDAGKPLHAASVVFRVKTLEGLEETLAHAFVGLFSQDADAINDAIIELAS